MKKLILGDNTLPKNTPAISSMGWGAWRATSDKKVSDEEITAFSLSFGDSGSAALRSSWKAVANNVSMCVPAGPYV